MKKDMGSTVRVAIAPSGASAARPMSAVAIMVRADCVEGDAWLVDISLRATSEILAPASPSGIAKNTRMFQAGV